MSKQTKLLSKGVLRNEGVLKCGRVINISSALHHKYDMKDIVDV